MANRSLLVLAACTLATCTTTDSAQIAALGAGLGSLPLVKLPPKKRPPSTHLPIPRLPTAVCSGKPDLALETSAGNTIGKFIRVCAKVSNVGGAAWTSNTNQLDFTFAMSVPHRPFRAARGFSSLAPGASEERCSWTRVDQVLRWGHDTPKYGECKLTMTATSRAIFDPDILLDGNTSNDDCSAGNNQDGATIAYMGSCPW
jgi:hypothetical protein